MWDDFASTGFSSVMRFLRERIVARERLRTPAAVEPEPLLRAAADGSLDHVGVESSVRDERLLLLAARIVPDERRRDREAVPPETAPPLHEDREDGRSRAASEHGEAERRRRRLAEERHGDSVPAA